MNINFDLIFYFFTLKSNSIHIGTHKQCVLWITINKIKILTTLFPSSIDYFRDDKLCGNFDFRIIHGLFDVSGRRS